MATRRNRIVVKPNLKLKPSAPKAATGTTATAAQKSKPPITSTTTVPIINTFPSALLDTSSNVAGIGTGKQAAVSGFPEKSAVATISGEGEKRKSVDTVDNVGSQSSVETSSGASGGNDNDNDNEAVKQKLNAHLLKKSVVSNLTEEFASVSESPDDVSDGSHLQVSISGGDSNGKDKNDAKSQNKELDVAVVKDQPLIQPVLVDVDDESSLKQTTKTTIVSQPQQGDSFLTFSPLSHNDQIIPIIDVIPLDKPGSSAVQTISGNKIDQVDKQAVPPSSKSGEITATDDDGGGLTESTAEGEISAPNKAPRKKREKKERKEPLPPCDKSPDRHKMKMSDLIIWNPSQNYFPKKKKTNNASVKKEAAERPKTPESIHSVNDVDDDDDESSNQSSALPAPRVMIGPDGNIILDTQSLIIETPKEDVEAKAVTLEDDDDRYLNSNTYRKFSTPKMWTEKENERFFMGLSMCGTDFSLMCKLLPKRSRRELKNKFRREERRNRFLIDKALSSRQPYDVAPFEKMAEEESAKLKADIIIKKEAKRRCKQEAREEKQRNIKKERERPKKRKAQESEDEEDDWGEEPEYDDGEDENQPEEEQDDEIHVVVDGRDNTNCSNTTAKRRKAGIIGNSINNNNNSQTLSPFRSTHRNDNDNNNNNHPRVFTPIEEDPNQPFVPASNLPNSVTTTTSTSPSVDYTTADFQEMIVVDENGNPVYNNGEESEPNGAVAAAATVIASNAAANNANSNMAAITATTTGAGTTISSSSSSSSTTAGAGFATGGPNITAASTTTAGGISTGLSSIPGSAPIRIEMEGVTTPMQGVLIPSHIVPQLAPQLGIPQSSTPMQVLLVQEEGSTNGGNMVHVYVLPEKESGTPFPQTGLGRVTPNESGQGMTLTSPIQSPRPHHHQPQPSPSSSSPSQHPQHLQTGRRRPSMSSAPASPFPPTTGLQNPSFPFRSPPQAASTSSSHHYPHPTDSETSLSTIGNVFGTAMSSLTPATPTPPTPNTPVSQQTHEGKTATTSGRLTVLSSHHPPSPQLLQQHHHQQHHHRQQQQHQHP